MTDAARQVITDARTMRALAHPLRVRLLEAIVRDGELTATQAAEMLGESPGNMSWHLQTLAKYGFIEEAGSGRGRSRPWRAVSRSRRFEIGIKNETDVASAGEALAETFLARTVDRLREWWSLQFTYPERWRKAPFITGTVAYLTPEEMETVADEVVAIYKRFDDRKDRDKRPEDAIPVHLYAHGHPLPPTPSGN